MPANSRISSVPSQKSGTLTPTTEADSVVAFVARLPAAPETPAATPTAVPRVIEANVSSSVTGSAWPISVETGVPLM